ncbi:MAG: prolyl oligopeptidase family serine peptidase [Alphaproteobacteria bacterium]|nr:prolyl oligopeptidase family serine peptidase [Alphaproteobacteria bacterium]
MRLLRRIFVWTFVTILALAGLAGALLGYFLYTPPQEVPHLSGQLTHGSMEAGGRVRTYLLYVPKNISRAAPLVIVLHGSGQSGAHVRSWTGYGFDRFADEHGFAVVYPDAFEGYWNGCNRVGDFAANKLDIDDVGFLSALADKLAAEIGIDPSRVLAAGVSRGGHMALRLALEAPSRFRAVAAVSASVPTPDNFKCKPAAGRTSSVMIMNGTLDPLNPFNGGSVNLYGFMARGTVLSSRQSAQYFADLNKIHGPPVTTETPVADGMRVERSLWHDGSATEVELVAIYGGGHGMPQPYWRYPRLLGPTPKEPNGPEVIWTFFARQRPAP